jgi:hypothetical protein
MVSLTIQLVDAVALYADAYAHADADANTASNTQMNAN